MTFFALEPQMMCQSLIPGPWPTLIFLGLFGKAFETGFVALASELLDLNSFRQVSVDT